MDNHTATELAYKNGYEQGLKDALKVVRCENCKHYSLFRHCKLHSTEPDQYGQGAMFFVEKDFFCKYGERRTNDA